MKLKTRGALTVLMCTLTGISLAGEKPVRFTPRLLTVDLNEGIDVADLNNDGKLDVLAGRNWFAAPDFIPRPVRTVPDWNQYVESNGDFTYDLNGDGYLDVVSGSFLPTEVYWFENPGEPALSRGEMWEPHLLVNTELSENERSFFRDLDGESVPEWITNSWNKKNPTMPGSSISAAHLDSRRLLLA